MISESFRDIQTSDSIRAKLLNNQHKYGEILQQLLINYKKKIFFPSHRVKIKN